MKRIKNRLDESVSKKISQYLEASYFIKWFKENRGRIADLIGVDENVLANTNSILRISRELINDVINPQAGGRRETTNKGFDAFVELEYVLIHDFLHNMYQADAKNFTKSLNDLEYSASEIIEEIECLAIEEKYMKWFNTKVASKERIEKWLKNKDGRLFSTYTSSEFTHQNLNQLASFLALTIIQDSYESLIEYYTDGTIKINIYGKEYDGKGTWLEQFYESAFGEYDLDDISKLVRKAYLAGSIISDYSGDRGQYPNGNWYGNAWSSLPIEEQVDFYDRHIKNIEWVDIPDDFENEDDYIIHDDQILWDGRELVKRDIFDEQMDDYGVFDDYEVEELAEKLGYRTTKDTKTMIKYLDSDAIAILRRSFRRDDTIGNNPNVYSGDYDFVSISRNPLTDNARRLENIMKTFIKDAIKDQDQLKKRFSMFHEPSEVKGVSVAKAGFGRNFFKFLDILSQSKSVDVILSNKYTNYSRTEKEWGKEIRFGWNNNIDFDEKDIKNYMDVLYTLSGRWDTYMEMVEKSSYYNPKVFGKLPTYQRATQVVDNLKKVFKKSDMMVKDLNSGMTAEEVGSKYGVEVRSSDYIGFSEDL